MEDVNKRRRNFLSLSKVQYPTNQLQGNLTFLTFDIRHFQRFGMNATKSEKKVIHFKSDVLAADAKTPYCCILLGELNNEGHTLKKIRWHQ